MKNVSLKPAFINKSNKTNDLNSRKILNKEKIVSKVNTDSIEKSNVKSKLKERIATIINERPNSVKGLDESKIILQENNQKVKPVVIQRPPAFLPGESS